MNDAYENGVRYMAAQLRTYGQRMARDSFRADYRGQDNGMARRLSPEYLAGECDALLAKASGANIHAVALLCLNAR